MSHLNPCAEKLFFSKNDPLDPRLGNLVNRGTAQVSILGYPDDEGIRLNGGRLGAAAGPDEIRHWLYRTTPHAQQKLKPFADLGNLKIQDSLDDRHRFAQEQVRALLQGQQQVLTLGGGNDYAFPDGMAFLHEFAHAQPLIINIDAHFDVRDMSHGPSSGTPFFRLLESPVPFAFVEYGIQGQCNAQRHWEYVEKKGGKIITLDAILTSDLAPLAHAVQVLEQTLWARRPTFLAVDIDAFAWGVGAYKTV